MAKGIRLLPHRETVRANLRRVKAIVGHERHRPVRGQPALAPNAVKAGVVDDKMARVKFDGLIRKDDEADLAAPGGHVHGREASATSTAREINACGGLSVS